MNRKLILNASPEEAFAITSFCERKGRSPREILLDACGFQNSEPFIFDIEPFIQKRRFPSGRDIDEPNPVKKKKIIQRRIWDELDDQKAVPPLNRGDQNKVYLQLLSQLLNWNKEKVSAKLESKRGTRHQYFDKTADVLQPHRIPNSEWYAHTKLNAEMKERILYDLLLELNFSRAYGRLIAGLVNDKRPRIFELQFHAEASKT
jgi:hypothetical protein